MNSRIWFFLYIAWTAAVVSLSLTPSPPEVTYGPLGWDKLQHGLSYAVMTLLGGMALGRRVRSPIRGWLFSAAIAIVVGILVEVAQGVMAVGRFADWRDAAANTLGAAGALVLAALCRYCRSRAFRADTK